MTWQMANSLSLMAIGLLLDLFSSDFAIVSTPSDLSMAIDCPGLTPWAGVCRVFDAGREIIPYNFPTHPTAPSLILFLPFH